MSGQDQFRRWGEKMRDDPPDPTVVSEMFPAATVIVLRDNPAGLETLMLRRSSKLAFAGGMWVFPGGRIDDADRRPDDGDDETAPARRAAVREAQEESGLVLDSETLVPFSHWEPPPVAPKRFSTWFFVAPAPDQGRGDVAIDDGEIKDHAWLRPADALARRDALDIELAPPTFVSLFELGACATVDEALAFAAARTPEHFTTKIVMDGDQVIALWHGDAGYGASVDAPGDPAAPGSRHRLHMLTTGWRYERS
jgi:8-oxo-dGTP pyrophosphatase MutT (NUDIX family)